MKGKITGVCAFAAAMVGLFMPVYRVPFLGGSSLFELSPVGGLVTLGVATVGVMASFRGRYIRTYLAGGAILLICLLTLWTYFAKVAGLVGMLDRYFLGAIGGFLADRAQLSWGLVWLVGSGLLFLRAGRRRQFECSEAKRTVEAEIWKARMAELDGLADRQAGL